MEESKNPEVVVVDISKVISDLLAIEREINYYFASELSGLTIKLDFAAIISVLIKTTNSYYEAIEGIRKFTELLSQHYAEFVPNEGQGINADLSFSKLEKSALYLINVFRSAGMYIDGFHHYKENLLIDPRTMVLVDTCELDDAPTNEVAGTYFSIRPISNIEVPEGFTVSVF